MIVLKMFLAPMAYAICAVSMVTLLMGCGGPAEPPGTTTQVDKPKHPNLKFHRPKTLLAAVQRLSIIHEAVNGEGKLPSPTSFDYVEVIHGRGPSAHSHFYLADNFDSVMEHDEEGHDEEEHETIERHTAVVDFRTEFADVVKWLPDIAAASDLGSADWQSISDVSKKMDEAFVSIPSDILDPTFRDSWKQKSSEIEAMLKIVQGTLAATTGDAK